MGYQTALWLGASSTQILAVSGYVSAPLELQRQLHHLYLMRWIGQLRSAFNATAAAAVCFDILWSLICRRNSTRSGIRLCAGSCTTDSEADEVSTPAS